MRYKIEKYLVAFLALLLPLKLSLDVIKSDGSDLVAWAGLLYLPFVVIVVLCSRLWAPLLLVSSLVPFGVPIGLLDRVPIVAWVMLPVTMTLMAQAMTRRGGGSGLLRSRMGRIWLWLSVLLTVRVLFDRPGAATFGARGGGSIALTFLIALWSFGLTYWACSHAGFPPRMIQWSILLGLLALVAYLFMGRSSVGEELDEVLKIGPWYRGHLFRTPTWFVYSGVLSLVVVRMQRKPLLMWISIAITVLGGLGVALTSVHRAFPLYALVMPMVVLLCWRKAHGGWIAAVLVFPLVVWLSRGYEDLPYYIQRPVSVFVPSKVGGEGGMGWEDEFRQNRMREAWTAISQNPIVGRGFSFSYAEVQRTSGGEGHFVLYHSYHNAFLNVAGACGLPLGLGVFLFVTVLMIRLFRDIRRLNDDRRRMVATFLFSTGVAIYLQSHVNGEGYLLTTMMVFLAAALVAVGGGPRSATEVSPANPLATSGGGVA